MEAIYFIFRSIEILIFVWCALVTLYMFVYATFSLFYKEKNNKKNGKMKISNYSDAPRIAVIIPAFKEDSVILKTAESALQQTYPTGKFQIIVVADSLQRSTIWKLNQLPIKLLEVSFENSTKAKAINTALNSISQNFDIAIVLDADNIISSDFLQLMAEAFQQGHSAIQGHRMAKNLNSPYALLDAISEEINNNLFSKGQRYLGMSSRLTGSGMGFEFNLFKDLMSNINAVGGFDKELELQLIKSNVKIYYLDNANILDEKVCKKDVLAKQRTRWIASQFHYLKKYIVSGIIELVLNRNVDYFNKTFQLAIPPRVFMVLLLLIGTSLSLLNPTSDLFINWIVTFAIYLMVFIIAFPRKYLGLKLFSLCFAIPRAMLKIVFATPNLFSANKKFIHTPHEV